MKVGDFYVHSNGASGGESLYIGSVVDFGQNIYKPSKLAMEKTLLVFKKENTEGVQLR